jgi:hypothetical protein
MKESVKRKELETDDEGTEKRKREELTEGKERRRTERNNC